MLICSYAHKHCCCLVHLQIGSKFNLSSWLVLLVFSLVVLVICTYYWCKIFVLIIYSTTSSYRLKSYLKDSTAYTLDYFKIYDAFACFKRGWCIALKLMTSTSTSCLWNFDKKRRTTCRVLIHAGHLSPQVSKFSELATAHASVFHLFNSLTPLIENTFVGTFE